MKNGGLRLSASADEHLHSLAECFGRQTRFYEDWDSDRVGPLCSSPWECCEIYDMLGGRH